MRELALEAAFENHYGWRRRVPGSGHVGEFSTCLHPDCVLIRSGEAEAEVQAQRLNVRDVELARQILATDNYMGVARDDAKRLARAVLDSHATTLGPPRRVWELCLDCDGDGHRGEAQGENGKLLRLIACETCGGHEDALGTGWVSNDEPWTPPAPTADLVEAAEWAETFLASITWTDDTSERNACDVRESLRQALAASRAETAPQDEALIAAVDAYNGFLDTGRRRLEEDYQSLRARLITVACLWRKAHVTPRSPGAETPPKAT